MRSARGHIPNFSLYGETPLPAAQTDRVHIEDIQSRSRKYLWKIGTHRHSLLSQCVLVTAGPVTSVLDDSRAALAGPAAMIIPAGAVHSFKFRSDTQGHVLTVDLARLLSTLIPTHRLPIEALFAMPRAIDLREDPKLAARAGELLDRLAQEFLQPDGAAAPVCGWLASSVLWILATGMAALGATGVPGRLDEERLRRFRGLIEAQYLKHWPVRRYARQLALSETTLNRLCRRLAGCTAFDLIRGRLALEARRRLVFSGAAIGRVAAELGFRDPAYFSRFFRRHCGAGPDEFRRRQHGG